MFSNHVNEAFNALLENGQIGRMEAGLVLTIIHQHLSEHLFSMLDYDVVRTIENSNEPSAERARNFQHWYEHCVL